MSQQKTTEKVQEKVKVGCKLVFTNDQLETQDILEHDFKSFQEKFPELTQVLLNPEIIHQIPDLLETLEKNNWK